MVHASAKADDMLSDGETMRQLAEAEIARGEGESEQQWAEAMRRVCPDFWLTP